jgi:hypothetical protein
LLFKTALNPYSRIIGSLCKRKKKMSAYQSAGFSNNLQSLLEAFQFFIERPFHTRSDVVVDGALFDLNDAPYLEGVNSHAEMERRLRQLDRSHLRALSELQSQV